MPRTSVLSSSLEETSSPPGEDAFTDAFAAEFAKGMESLLKGLDGTFKPEEASGLTAEEMDQEKKFNEAWSKILNNIEPSTSTSTSTTPASAAQSSQKGPEGSFQDRIKQTMDKMKEGQSSLKVRDPTDETRQYFHLSSLAMKAVTPTWRRSCHLWAT